MELAEALDIVAEKYTPRFRELCDPGHPDYNPANIPIVLRLARGESPHPPRPIPPTKPAETKRAPGPTPRRTSPEGAKAVALIRQAQQADELVNRCPHRGCRTGCGQAECRAGRGDLGEGGLIASIGHCRRCVRGENGPAPLDVALLEWWLESAEQVTETDRATLNTDFYAIAID